MNKNTNKIICDEEEDNISLNLPSKIREKEKENLKNKNNFFVDNNFSQENLLNLNNNKNSTPKFLLKEKEKDKEKKILEKSKPLFFI